MSMENHSSLENKIASLLKSKKFAVLSTESAGQPYANLVAFVEDKDLKTIFFATKRSTRKFENITANTRIALLVENSTNADIDIKEATAATIIGRATVSNDDEKARIIPRYVKKHTLLGGFCEVLRMCRHKTDDRNLCACGAFSTGKNP